MKSKGIKYTPRNTTLTVRVREESDINLTKFCKEFGFNKSEAVDLLLKWIGKNGKKIDDDLQALRQADYPHWQR